MPPSPSPSPFFFYWWFSMLYFAGQLYPTVTDFGLGIAKTKDTTCIPLFRDLRPDETKRILGRCPQMAPEIVVRKWVSNRSDMFGLGIIFEKVAELGDDEEESLAVLARGMRRRAVRERPEWEYVSKQLKHIEKMWSKKKNKKSNNSSLQSSRDRIPSLSKV